MQVAVCIVGFRNPGDIANCLAALQRSTHSDFRVFICENGGADAFKALRASLPERLGAGQDIVSIDPSANLGFAGGVNACIAASPDAEAWWVLNPDTIPEPDALEQLCLRLARGDCDAVSCTVHYADGTIESRGGYWNRWMARASSVDHGLSVDCRRDARVLEARINYLTGACMLVNREFIERGGVMREDYFLYAEEIEWCLRARAAGLRLGLVPEARVLHHKGTTTGGVSSVSDRRRIPVYLDERNKILVTRDCFPALLPIAALGALALLAMRFGRKRAWRQLGFAFAGWRAGLMNERGKPEWVGRELGEALPSAEG